MMAGKARNHGGGAIGCNERLGGLLKYYHLEAAGFFLTTRVFSDDGFAAATS